MMIIPTIKEKDFNEAEKRLKEIIDLSAWVQIDVIDGILAEGKSFEMELLTRTEINSEGLLLDVHLMVKEPVNWIKKAVFISAARVIGQVEMMKDREEFVSRVKEEGMDTGLAFDIGTDIDDKIPVDTDVILLMGRQMGFGSYPLEERVFEKIARLKKLRQEREGRWLIGIDGGVTGANIVGLKEAGADIAYCGGAIFKGKIRDNFDNLNSLAEKL